MSKKPITQMDDETDSLLDLLSDQSTKKSEDDEKKEPVPKPSEKRVKFQRIIEGYSRMYRRNRS